MANVARAIIVGESDTDEGTEVHVQFVDEDGEPVTVGSAPTVSTILLTGYTAGSAGALAAGDTLLAALRKLEARVLDLETP